mmetsp:Transcript_16500/g.42303  ORF Transcript_16500/g.42303 Transcript_16500/m.42303 type:complete len:244 (+) Transcript_16500:178-909(+)
MAVPLPGLWRSWHASHGCQAREPPAEPLLQDQHAQDLPQRRPAGAAAADLLPRGLECIGGVPVGRAAQCGGPQRPRAACSRYHERSGCQRGRDKASRCGPQVRRGGSARRGRLRARGPRLQPKRAGRRLCRGAHRSVASDDARNGAGLAARCPVRASHRVHRRWPHRYGPERDVPQEPWLGSGNDAASLCHPLRCRTAARPGHAAESAEHRCGSCVGSPARRLRAGHVRCARGEDHRDGGADG